MEPETEPAHFWLCPSPSELTSPCHGLQAGPGVEPERSYIAKCAELACRPSTLVLSQLRLRVLNLSHMPLDDPGVCLPLTAAVCAPQRHQRCCRSAHSACRNGTTDASARFLALQWRHSCSSTSYTPAAKFQTCGILRLMPLPNVSSLSVTPHIKLPTYGTPGCATQYPAGIWTVGTCACPPRPCWSELLLMRLLQPPRLTPAGIESVGVCVSTSPHLRELRLNGTQLGDAGLLLLLPHLEVRVVQHGQTSGREGFLLITTSALHCS